MTTKIILGATQIEVLKGLLEHKGWQYGCGWVWKSQGGTEKTMNSLVNKSLAQKDETGLYTITSKGEEVIKDLKNKTL